MMPIKRFHMMPKLSLLFLCVLLFITRSIEAEVSEQCASEGKTLAVATDLVEPKGGCTVDVTVSSECSFDFATISSNYSQTCKQIGGQFHEETITWDCTLGPYNVSFQYVNQPACIGASCSSAEAEEIFINTLAPSSEAIFAAQGLECTFTIDTAAGNPPETEENKSTESASVALSSAAFPLVALFIVTVALFV
jgi:hypothetical protein